jgi:co-chaperonin GroES (HSP10)
MTVTLHPLMSHVLIRLRPLPEKTGSIIRVSRQEYAREAEVLAVGPECRDVSVGDRVVVTTLAGQVVNDAILIPESSILAFVEVAV